MFTVKFVGGSKKSFLTEQIQVDKSDISVNNLLDLLAELKPQNTPQLDADNILIAINGVDCSALDGKLTRIKKDDVVSIIPVIHGGSSDSIQFEICRKQILVVEIKGRKTIDVKFLDALRTKYPKIQLQAVSRKFILNKYHLKKILQLSLESNKQKILLSNKLEMDILMRFALTNQISYAISSVGLKPNTNFVLIGIGNKKTLSSISKELETFSVTLFSKNHESFLKKYAHIPKKQLDSIHSTHPLEDLLTEKAATLF